jgi:Ca-activated chloride channel family protein
MNSILTKPVVAITPRFAGAPKNADTSMDFLIELLMPAKLEAAAARAPLNLALVIDSSTSMNQHAYYKPGTEIPGRWEQQLIHPVTPMPPFGPAQPFWLEQQNPIAYGHVANPFENGFPGGVAAERGVEVPAFPEGLGNAKPGYQWVYIQPVKLSRVSVSKLQRVKEAAHVAIDALRETDRISIVIFSDTAKVVFNSAAATPQNKFLAKAAVNQIRANGNTALDDGWRLGATEVVSNLTAESVNRVLLLTDGRANVGEQRQDYLVGNVKGLVPHGVTTSCFGVGQDYSEDLLQAMAEAGDGRYYYLDESSITDKFIEEFSGLSQLLGRNLRLQVVGLEGAAIEKCLNDFPLDGELYALPNAVRGHNQQVVIRAKLNGAGDLSRLGVVLNWTDTSGGGHQEVSECVLPTVAQAVFTALKEDAKVGQRVGELEIALAKKEAIKALDRGDINATRSILSGATAFASQSCYGDVAMEAAKLMTLSAMANSGDTTRLRKTAKYEQYETRSSRK